MTDFDNFLKKTITKSVSYDETVKPGIKWEFKFRDDKVFQYKAKIDLSGKKHLYLILTRRKLMSNEINIYLEVYLTVKPNNEAPYNFLNTESPNNGYKYKSIISMYLSKYPDLMKLYGIVKYNNYVTYTRTKKLFVKDLIEWTEEGLIPWSYDGQWFYKCSDVKYKGMEIFIKAGRQRVFIFLHGGKYKHYSINNILLDTYSKDLLYDTIKKSK